MLVTACRLAISPTRTSPFLANATTDGVVRPPSAFAMIVGSPPSRTATAELVVPRSMPTARAISYLLYDEWSGEHCPPLCCFIAQCAPQRPELSSRRSAKLRLPHSTLPTDRLYLCRASRSSSPSACRGALLASAQRTLAASSRWPCRAHRGAPRQRLGIRPRHRWG